MDNTFGNLSFGDINNIQEIKIFSEKRGKKTNTYMTGWNVDKNELKDHLKNLKRKHGCNGSIKEKIFQGNNCVVLHLQGEWKDAVKNYLVINNVNESDIEIKL
jgi:translation initiation factor 1 (eIF-1/SUI1)